MEAINIIHVMKLNCFKLLVYWLTVMTFGSQWMKWHLCRMYEANCIRLAIPPITSQLPHHTLSAPHPVFSPLFPLSRESLAPLVLFSNTNLTGHTAFFSLLGWGQWVISIGLIQVSPNPWYWDWWQNLVWTSYIRCVSQTRLHNSFLLPW